MIALRGFLKGKTSTTMSGFGDIFVVAGQVHTHNILACLLYVCPRILLHRQKDLLFEYAHAAFAPAELPHSPFSSIH